MKWTTETKEQYAEQRRKRGSRGTAIARTYAVSKRGELGGTAPAFRREAK